MSGSSGRLAVGTFVTTRWGDAVVTHDYAPADPNYAVRYLNGPHAGTTGAFTSLVPSLCPKHDRRKVASGSQPVCLACEAEEAEQSARSED
jgi:hypothetical protein